MRSRPVERHSAERCPGTVRPGPSMDLILDFLLQPISGASEHHVSEAHKWHARLMVVAWGVLIPTGIVVARYFKVTRRQNWPAQLDNQFWWVSHLLLQIGGCLLSLVALVYVFGGSGGYRSGTDPSGTLAAVHGVLGWSIALLALSQLVGGALRGTRGHHQVVMDAELRALIGSGDHYDMTLRRCVFEYAHKLAGYAALVLSAANILLGLTITDAPRWMWIVIVGFWALLGALAVVLQRQGRCVDTYQAIYGPEPALPGNRRPPIGWGVRRYSPEQWPPRRVSPARTLPVPMPPVRVPPAMPRARAPRRT